MDKQKENNMWPAIAMGAASLASGLIGSGSQRKENRRAEKDAREHNLKMWNLQNQYNHPTQQMGRLQEAGLNPNMIYGTSPSSAVGSAGDVSPGKAPDQPVSLGNPFEEMSRYFNIEQSKAQTDNLNVQNTVLSQEALLKSAQRANTVLNTSRGEFDLGIAKELRDTSLQAARNEVKLQQENIIGRTIDNYVNDATKANQIKASILGIKNAQETLTGQQLQNEIRKYEINLNRLGIQKNDPLWTRFLGREVSKDTGVLNDMFKFREQRKGRGFAPKKLWEDLKSNF